MGECGLRGGYSEICNMDPAVKSLYLKSISAKLCPTGTLIHLQTNKQTNKQTETLETNWHFLIATEFRGSGHTVLGQVKEQTNFDYVYFNSIHFKEFLMCCRLPWIA